MQCAQSAPQLPQVVNTLTPPLQILYIYTVFHEASLSAALRISGRKWRRVQQIFLRDKATVVLQGWYKLMQHERLSATGLLCWPWQWSFKRCQPEGLWGTPLPLPHNHRRRRRQSQTRGRPPAALLWAGDQSNLLLPRGVGGSRCCTVRAPAHLCVFGGGCGCV